MKSLEFRKVYANIDYWDNRTDSPGVSRFANLDAWCSMVGVWHNILTGTAPYIAVVGLKEREWDATGR